MSRYTKEHCEDVADVLRHHTEDTGATYLLIEAFADLFATDNPPVCQHKGHLAPCGELCLTGGFDRARFLAACGLKDQAYSDYVAGKIAGEFE